MKDIFSIVYDCLSTIYQFLYYTPEEIRWIKSEELTKQILKRHDVIKEGKIIYTNLKVRMLFN